MRTLAFGVGDPVPWFQARASNGSGSYDIGSVAGRYVVLCFLGSAGEAPARQALAAVARRRQLFDDWRASFFGISVDPADQAGRLRQELPGIRFFWDTDHAISRLYGASQSEPGQPAPAYEGGWLVLDPMLRVLASAPLEADERVLDLIAGLPPVDGHAGGPLHAPVLILPRVFEPEFCRALIAQYELHGGQPSGFMREEGGKTVTVLDDSFKRRADFLIADEMVRSAARERLLRRVVPAVAQAFQFRATRMERYIVACYDAGQGTGGTRLPTLSYEQARDLVAAVAAISGHRIALFLDQWEKSPDVGREAKALDAFIHHLDDWPRCHVFLALRPDEPAYGSVQKLEASLPGPVEIYRLEGMQLAAPAERTRLVDYVQKSNRAAAQANDDTLLDLVDGYPGVLYQWTNAYQRERMRTRTDLERIAADAQAYRFSELDEVLPTLPTDQRRLAIRLVLLPGGGGPVWNAIKAEVLEGLDAGLIDDLCLAKVLESADPPGFGHARRWEMARAWFLEHRRKRRERRGGGADSPARCADP